MRFGKWILAASLPLLLTGCGGGGLFGDIFGNRSSGQAAQGAPIQTLLENATNLEMTDRTRRVGDQRITCSGTVCESFGGNGNFSLAAYHSQWLRDASTSGNAAFGADDNYRFQKLRRLGQHSGYYTLSFRYANTGVYAESFSAAFGGPERKPVSGIGRWTGDMGGHDTRNGTQLTGKSTVTYSFGDNTVDVRLYDIRGTNYIGDRELSWDDMTVRNDGSFYYSGSDYVAGNFYGPNAEETTGIFEDGTLAGAWFADR